MKNTSLKRLLALIFSLLFVSTACRKDYVNRSNDDVNEPISVIERIDPKKRININEIVVWMTEHLDIDMRASVRTQSAQQSAIKGQHVIMIPIAADAALYFTKENGVLKAWIYKWLDKKTNEKEFTGNLIVYSYQDGRLYGTVYEKGKTVKWGIMSVGDISISKNTKYKVNQLLGWEAVAWCIFTGRGWDDVTRYTGKCKNNDSIFLEAARKVASFFSNLFGDGGGGGGYSDPDPSTGGSEADYYNEFWMGTGNTMPNNPGGSGGVTIGNGTVSGSIPLNGEGNIWMFRRVPNDPATCLDGYTTLPRLGADGCPINMPKIWETVQMPENNSGATLITLLDINDVNKQMFLASHANIADELLIYLMDNTVTQENEEFVNWAVEYLMANPALFNQAFKDLLNGVFNENSPIYVPENFDIIYEQTWYDAENLFATLGTELQQQGMNKTSPIPEAYYKFGTPVDMHGAPAKNGYTALGAPRNAAWFWKKLLASRPEMFSAANRASITQRIPNAPTIDPQWLKFNPAHKSYLGGKLIHHHDGQGFIAYAIPEKVHLKWSSILHRLKADGKITQVGRKLNAFFNLMEVFGMYIDIRTNNPDAWVNWFGAHNEVGVIYKDPINDVYFEIMDKNLVKNSMGIPVKATVHYFVYSDSIWDEDENRYMGVNKIGEFTEELDLVNKTSREIGKTFM